MAVQIEDLRKIELHRHIEGCIDARFLHQLLNQFYPDDKLLQNNNIDNLFNYSTFQDFLRSWSTVMSYLNDYEHFRELARYVISQLEDENIIYVELIFSPQPFVSAGLNTEQLFTVMYDEFRKVDVDTKVIVDFVRNFGAEAMKQYLPELINLKLENDDLGHWIRAVSIGGDEVNYPAGLFETSFKQAKQAGFHMYAHAGEWTDANSVWESINKLGIERIGHGVKAVHDDTLIQYLKDHKIGLDISITSNYLTAAIERKETHPVADLFTNNCMVSLNTDDPGFFHTDLNNEYQRFVDLGFKVVDLEKMVYDAVESTFLKDDEKEQIRKNLKTH